MTDDLVIRKADGVTSLGVWDEATGDVVWFAHAGTAAQLIAASQSGGDARCTHLRSLVKGVDLDAVLRAARKAARLALEATGEEAAVRSVTPVILTRPKE